MSSVGFGLVVLGDFKKCKRWSSSSSDYEYALKETLDSKTPYLHFIPFSPMRCTVSLCLWSPLWWAVYLAQKRNSANGSQTRPSGAMSYASFFLLYKLISTFICYSTEKLDNTVVLAVVRINIMIDCQKINQKMSAQHILTHIFSLFLYLSIFYFYEKW